MIRPQFSGFYSTNPPAPPPKPPATRLVGVAADIRVLFTAADAHMRECDLRVSADTVASAEA